MQPNVTKEVIELVQTSLNKHYRKNLKVDGIAGNNTEMALRGINELSSSWGLERKIIGYIQHICKLEDIEVGEVDGFWGPQTDYAYGILKDKMTGVEITAWRDDEGIGGTTTPDDKWPLQTQDNLEAFYGKPGTGQVKFQLPYPVKIAWNTDKTITKFSCHNRVSESLLRVLTNVKNTYGLQRIQSLGLDMWGGCLNVRKMRGGTKWSTHSWGIALDWDPARNRLRWNKYNANFSLPDYGMWWKHWEDEGWVSLGRERDYDWMHVQAAKIKKD
jgi:hypothetical protein